MSCTAGYGQPTTHLVLLDRYQYHLWTHGKACLRSARISIAGVSESAVIKKMILDLSFAHAGTVPIRVSLLSSVNWLQQ